MFASLIKAFRESQGLSQEDFAQILVGFNGRESIDITTISRWERGVSSPSIANQVYILRKLAVPFSLASIVGDYSSQSVINLLNPRFSRFQALADKPYRTELPQFRYSVSCQLTDFLGDKELRKFGETMFSTDFNTAFFKEYLLGVELDDVHIYRFYRDQNLVGHLAYAVADTRVAIELLERLYETDIRSAFSSEMDGKVLLNFSAYASDFALYLFFAKVQIQALAKNDRIDWFVGHSFINEDWQVHKKLGGKCIYRGESVDIGGVKIGKAKFQFLIFNSQVPSLLASPLGLLCAHDLDTEYAAITKLASSPI